ncbi:hypothetical protein Bca52824_011363 [Brassica carinata]|uniref:Uncharacterized protein n=1 Tax=Brassica carinata TaxID=52824 RepID=A0A8X7WH15_BRACI|nr:hypothetical protein Bca52824_011363 [Brassica carinata]
MICVVQPDEYGVYKNKEGNAKTMYERIINVSKEDIEAILEVADTLGGRYQSLPQYERCFEMPRVHPTPPYLPEANTYTRDLVKDLIEDVFKAQDRIFDEFYKKIDAIYFPLDNSVSWLSKCMDEQLKLDYTYEIIKRQKEHDARGEKQSN